MPVHIRDDGTPGPTRRAIFFVHGFKSSAATWQKLRALLERDEAITADFDLFNFSYETELAAKPITGRLPTIDDAGKRLMARLNTELIRSDGEEEYIEATLVGHSMGGLIIQSCLLNLLTPEGSLRTLNQIRQVILFATPNFGSTTLGRIRRLLSAVIDNPQERALRLFSEESTRIHDEIRKRVIFARRRERDEYPIPFYCFWGESDGVVLAESAKGHFPAGEPLPGDHFTVHCPATRGDDCYRQFVSALLHPYGHTNIWELERFTMSVKVAPVPPGTATVAKYGTKQRTVVHDNVANVVRKATFSRHNRCREPYVLKYGTRNGGWIVPRISEPHITPADKLRLYDDNGCDAYYEVDPKPGESASLTLTVYKGFDEGHRDFHMHLGRQTYFRRVCFDVDLSEYRKAGWIVRTPLLYFHPTDPGDHALCDERQRLNPDPPHVVDEAGIWRWELEFITEGVIDLAWDVSPPAPIDAPITEIHLKPGEHAIFGYGSLLSVASLERTLGRPYGGPFVVCAIDGWRRRWNVAMPNDVFAYRDKDAWVTPAKIFYLNVEPEAGALVNGILFVVNSDDLERFDRREWIYDRVNVTSVLRGVHVDGGAAWVYRGKPEHVFTHPTSPSEGAIRRTYIDILDTGHRQLGADFTRAYDATTDPIPQSLVVDDVRRDDMIGP